MITKKTSELDMSPQLIRRPQVTMFVMASLKKDLGKSFVSGVDFSILFFLAIHFEYDITNFCSNFPKLFSINHRRQYFGSYDFVNDLPEIAVTTDKNE